MSNDWGAIWPLLRLAEGKSVVFGTGAFCRERLRCLLFYLALVAVAAAGSAGLAGGLARTVILILLLLLGLMFGSLLILVGNDATSLASFP
jgi:hypothetical protein